MTSFKPITLSIISFLIIGTKAYADLSPNPWLIPNDKETINQIYNKKNQRANKARTVYQEEAAPEIDLGPKEDQSQNIESEQESLSLKLKDIFSKDKQEKLPSPPKKLPPQNIKPNAKTSPSVLEDDAFGFDGVIGSVKRGLNRVWNKTVYYYNRAKRSLQLSIRKLSRKF